MNREYIICYLFGFVEAVHHELNAIDKIITVDQLLLKFNMPPMTPEERLNIVEELVAQIDMTLMYGKINRSQLRHLANRAKKT